MPLLVWHTCGTHAAGAALGICSSCLLPGLQMVVPTTCQGIKHPQWLQRDAPAALRVPAVGCSCFSADGVATPLKSMPCAAMAALTAPAFCPAGSDAARQCQQLPCVHRVQGLAYRPGGWNTDRLPCQQHVSTLLLLLLPPANQVCAPA
jgi:hypothetical protein